jgi:gas vesicle protein
MGEPYREKPGEHLTICIRSVLINMSPCSPAQGAMYAPLALMFVFGESPIFFKAPADFPQSSCHQITANHTTANHTTTNHTTTTGTSPKSHTGTIIGGAIGGVAVLLMLATISLVIRRRKSQSQKRTSVGSSSSLSFLKKVTNKSFQVTGTAAQSAYTEVVGSQTVQQEQMVHPFVPFVSPRSSSGVASIPVGLTSKELAHLRSLANGSRPEPTDGQPPPDSSSESAARIDRDAHVPMAAEATALPEAQTIWSEFNLLRNEVQQLRAERSEAPPTYFSGEAA